MRTEKEIMDLILTFAENDKRIRVVGMEGSHINPNVPEDIFQDYDISYLVTDMQAFIADKYWIDIFGERIIMQTPEAMSLFPPSLGGWFSYLMLFTDGNRIDLKIIPIEDKDKYISSDKLIKILLDKDGVIPVLTAPSDIDYRVKKPSGNFYNDCCNEFFWVSTYVAKELWRQELLYANDHINNYIRPSLLRMMDWKVGIQTNFSVSTGKNHKYLPDYITAEEWESLKLTYRNSDYNDCWNSLFLMISLFRESALFVADAMGFVYPEAEERNVSSYLEKIRNLPPDALSFI